MERGLVKREEEMKALHKTKCDKMIGVNDNVVKFLKKGGDCVADWLVRIIYVCMDHGKVPEDWKNASRLPLCKDKGEEGVFEQQRYTSDECTW